MKDTIYAVMHEGQQNVSRDFGVHRGIITAISYWDTREDAQAAFDRVWERGMRSWYKPKRRWIAEITDTNYDHALTTHPEWNAPEYARP